VSKKDSVKVRLLFVDDGSYHHEEVRVAAKALESHDRLIDALREDPGVLRSIYLDVERLCGAWILDTDGD
jgi:hypothetical protein